MAALRPAVLDVVVHEAEVVAHLHRRRARQGAGMVARDGLVGQQADERAHALATGRLAIQAEVVANHVVQLARALILGLGDDGARGVAEAGDEPRILS